MKADELKGWWAVEWCAGLGFSALPLMEMLERNYRLCMNGEDSTYSLLGLFPDMASSEIGVTDLRRKWKDEKREGELNREFTRIDANGKNEREVLDA